MDNLNKEQLSAARAPFGHNLIIASAGTGKTSTIVGRINHLLLNGVLPNEILLLTFTNKAAKEMLARIESKLGEASSGINAGTFHAIAYKYLKSQNENLTLKQPRELKTLLRSLYGKRAFGEGAYSANYLYDLYSYYNNTIIDGTSFGDYLSNRKSSGTKKIEEYLLAYEDLIEEFKEAKRSYGYVDYNDLLTDFRDKIKEYYKTSTTPLYREVLCDEYQDTNPLQYSILQALNPPSLFCVGDYDQSIYAFNGADINIISNFKDDFRGANIFSLSQNYRSAKEILDIANLAISHNERIYPKNLEVVKKQSGIIKVIKYDSTSDQALNIAQRISTSTTSYDEIAVIFRNNSSADIVEARLREMNIKVKRKGGNSFFETREISTLLDLMMILVNSKDMMSYINILSYASGIGEAVAKDIYDALLALGDGDSIEGMLNPKDINIYKSSPKSNELLLFDDLKSDNASRFDDFIKSNNKESDFASHKILEHSKLNENSALFLSYLYDFIASITPLILANAYMPEIMEQIIESKIYSFMTNALAKSRSVRKDGHLDQDLYHQKLNSIYKKANVLKELSKEYSGLNKFLNAMILSGSEENMGTGVNLLTIHASKGLEFEEVYIIDLAQGRFPNLKLAKSSGSIEEERRLFYVAVTRAKSKLTMSYTTISPDGKTNAPSQFLEEIKRV